MRKLAIALVPLLILAFVVGVTGCGDGEEDTPGMTAPEVCQYVNQALPDEYIAERVVLLRSEIRYAALSAEYVGDGIWQVAVKVTTEYQVLSALEGQWIADYTRQPEDPIEMRTEQYIFNEATGAVTKQQPPP
jgi:hypothetical protein